MLQIYVTLAIIGFITLIYQQQHLNQLFYHLHE
nr:MAG TPA: hypothetical protein [Caudoviricetes sp.]